MISANFSVLMSLYGKEKPEYLKLALESIYASTLTPAEVILVIDGPITEELKSVIKEYPQIKEVKLAVNSGLSNALNIGLKHCSYEFVARMDTDDVCHHERFAKQINWLNNNNDVDVVGTFAKKIDESGNEIGLLKVPTGHNDIYNKIWTCPFIHPTVMFRRSKLLSVGGYNPNSGPRQDDYELWFRCASQGLIFDNIPEELFFYRFFSDSVKKNTVKVGWWRMKVGLKGCKALGLPLIARIGVCIPLIRALLPYPLNIWFNNLMNKVNPRNN